MAYHLTSTWRLALIMHHLRADLDMSLQLKHLLSYWKITLENYIQKVKGTTYILLNFHHIVPHASHKLKKVQLSSFSLLPASAGACVHFASIASNSSQKRWIAWSGSPFRNFRNCNQDFVFFSIILSRQWWFTAPHTWERYPVTSHRIDSTCSKFNWTIAGITYVQYIWSPNMTYMCWKSKCYCYTGTATSSSSC